ncbi:MAG: hypothetical protein Q9M91_00570 [Candidatus Dojkabacteria bacterium]|nr:hypothetical protein [Candidatus Dojkabacteria bacterium]MDQ7020323.1 hypothetical protein [Candidatus Dojkabacteria bacterium]
MNRSNSQLVFVIGGLLLIAAALLFLTFDSVDSTVSKDDSKNTADLNKSAPTREGDIVSHIVDGFYLEAEFKGGNSWDFVINGSVPNPCYTYDTEVIIAESFPEQVTVNLDVNKPAEGLICTQVIEEVTINGSYQADENSTVRLKVNRK